MKKAEFPITAMKNAPAPLSMQHPVRRGERELERGEAERILRQGEYGILCTCGEDGVPYGVPVCFVYDGKSIGFHSATEGHKVQNLLHNPHACFTVVGETEVLPDKFSVRYESAIAFGCVSRARGERKQDILRALIDKYSPDFLQKGEAYIHHDADKTAVYELEILRLSGKARR